MRTFAALFVFAVLPAFVVGGGEKILVVDVFDGAGPKLGASWETYNDDNNLGTKVNAFAIVKEGAPKDSKGFGHFSGHVGKSMAPWPWAAVDLAFNADGPKDVSGFTHLRFKVKGDDKKYRVRLGRTAVEDYCDFEYPFLAPKEWTVVEAPLKDFVQPSWGKKVAWGVSDVTKVGMLALAPGNDEDFDLKFTDVEFIVKGK